MGPRQRKSGLQRKIDAIIAASTANRKDCLRGPRRKNSKGGVASSTGGLSDPRKVTKVTLCETLFFYVFSFFSEKRIERTVTFVTATNTRGQSGPGRGYPSTAADQSWQRRVFPRA